jgi:U3 small nucleolar ribonucleoprotein protein IMP4
MLRRQTRLRREYLYRKSLEEQERQTYEKKRQIREAVAMNKPIPTELRDAELKLRDEMEFDGKEAPPIQHMDDEYAKAGVRDPKILLTTSRDPSSRLKQFIKEMKLMFPNSQRINRGNYVMKDIVEACRSNDVTDLIIFHEHRGEPDGMVICHFPYGPTAYFSLHNVILRHDIPNSGTVSEQAPHLIFDNFTTRLGERIQTILKYLFPVPKKESKRVFTFSNQEDYISFRHHVYQKLSHKEVQLVEVGPRFELRRKSIKLCGFYKSHGKRFPYNRAIPFFFLAFQIKLATVDAVESADVEWVLRPYMRTAKKRILL